MYRMKDSSFTHLIFGDLEGGTTCGTVSESRIDAATENLIYELYSCDWVTA